MRKPTKQILLVSCYELGHQPSGLSMPLAFLQRAGYRADCLDLSVQQLDHEKVARADFIGISVPMHTALRLGIEAARMARSINPHCHICFYGLYAALNAEHLLKAAADSVIAGEFEQELLRLIDSLNNGGVHKADPVTLERLRFPTPERSPLPPPSQYAKLEYNGSQKLVAYTEASRGCLHLCTHCPIPPVYEGRFFVVPRDVVMEDIRGQVATGAEHLTFGDPDFLNGPGHSIQILRDLHREFPKLTFDFTAKIEHLIKYRSTLSEFARLGCIFIVSAVESLSDVVLSNLQKGHTRSDVMKAFDLAGELGITLRPSLVPFTPWATIADFIDLLEFVDARELIYHVDPVQFSIRLLIPPGSLILRYSSGADWLGPLAEDSFTYLWTHPDSRMDELQDQISHLVEQAGEADPAETFTRICDLTGRIAGKTPMRLNREPGPAIRPPRLTESWFCCAEPTRQQVQQSKLVNLTVSRG